MFQYVHVHQKISVQYFFVACFYATGGTLFQQKMLMFLSVEGDGKKKEPFQKSKTTRILTATVEYVHDSKQNYQLFWGTYSTQKFPFRIQMWISNLLLHFHDPKYTNISNKLGFNQNQFGIQGQTIVGDSIFSPQDHVSLNGTWWVPRKILGYPLHLLGGSSQLVSS